MPKQTSTNKRNRSAADLDGDSDVEDLDKVLPGKVVDKAAHDTFMRSAGYVPVPSAPFVPGHCFFDALRHLQLDGEPKGGLVLRSLHLCLRLPVRREEERRKKKKEEKKERKEKGGGKREGGGREKSSFFNPWWRASN